MRQYCRNGLKRQTVQTKKDKESNDDSMDVPQHNANVVHFRSNGELEGCLLR